MLKVGVTVVGAALLLNVNVASAAKRSFQQKSGANAVVGVNGQVVGANGQLDACRSWTLNSSLSETSIKVEPGATEVANRALLSFSISNECDYSFTYFDVDVPNVAKLTGNLTGASLDLNQPVAVTSCAYVNDNYECTESTAQMTVSLKWSSNGSPVRFRQHITNLSPDGVRSSIRVDGNSRDSTTTGSLSINGQTYVLTTENVHSSSLTTDAQVFVVLRK